MSEETSSAKVNWVQPHGERSITISATNYLSFRAGVVVRDIPWTYLLQKYHKPCLVCSLDSIDWLIGIIRICEPCLSKFLDNYRDYGKEKKEATESLLPSESVGHR